ncbi:MAG: DUF1156 domain-containing protein, partial [Acidobacteriota bacterium]
MANNNKRLVEVAFPLKQTSLDSVHEKNVRHGHLSTLHIWPARRPLAASRAALIATLLPDPGTKEERDLLLQRLGGTVVEVLKKKNLPNGRTEEKVTSETVGGILHWGRESNPDIEWFKKKIIEAFGGLAPKFLDPFAGGGAIPLEAMRLGCKTTAIDINPVAWFILKCTLEYPQQLARQHRPLPEFALRSPDFMQQFFKGTGKLTRKQLERNLKAVQDRLFPPPDVDLPWHVRAWGWWVLHEAQQQLSQYYPVIEGKPTVAYLWARTAKCKSCRATIPLLKTRWLCKKDAKRVLLVLTPSADKSSVTFTVESGVPQAGGNIAQRRENDKKLGAGTMSRSGVSCPCCTGAIMTMEELRAEGLAGRFGAVLTAVVVDGPSGKEYRPPTAGEKESLEILESTLDDVFASVPFGMPHEPTPGPAGTKRNSSSLRLYGLLEWKDIFTSRQLLALGTFVLTMRRAHKEMLASGYPADWAEAIMAYLGCSLSRLADYSSTVCIWALSEFLCHTFTRYALPITWDFVEGNPIGNTSGNYAGAIDWVARFVEHACAAMEGMTEKPTIIRGSSKTTQIEDLDLVVTDPPYYDAIAYADLMDFFYIWLRRLMFGVSPEFDDAFKESQTPKWNHAENDGELVDDPSRHGGNLEVSKRVYEDGMFESFSKCHKGLSDDGRMVVVFANKQPDAWEALVSAIIRAGFVVDGSWPIQTERETRMRAYASAALASSVWLVCKKRPETARPGWDNTVLSEMTERIQVRLREFWDAGVRGPDFVWAATGPALEVFSKHPVVKKANAAGQLMSVSEFLHHVRRIVVDFIVGQVLSHGTNPEKVSGLDDVTTYYILHRYDFGFSDAPMGACILYAVSCGLTDRELTDRYEILSRTGAQESDDELELSDDLEPDEVESDGGGGSKAKLKLWNQRGRKSLGDEAGGRPAPLIDQIHRLMHLWKAGDVVKVDDYIESKA